MHFTSFLHALACSTKLCLKLCITSTCYLPLYDELLAYHFG